MVTKTENSKAIIFLSITMFLVILLIVITSFFVLKSNPKPNKSSGDSSTVSQENGKQVINLTAKNGYSPKNITAKANIPSILKINTNKTYDCSSDLKIPDLQFSKILTPTGTTEVEIPAKASRTQIKGLCGMAMYSFVINFE